jgi:glycine cleavage system P protein (glycine dehydrogenase) subunit 1
MPFIPHTAADVRDMLATIGTSTIDTLFDEIPAALRAGSLTKVPEGVSEMDMLALMAERAERDRVDLCFVGAGSYDHHVPAAVWDVAQRGEFLTAYTPYQAEASQGTLQLIYEYQSMIAALTAMDVSNASVYDGGSGLAEAVLMAVRANKKNKSRHVLMPDTVNPRYRDATRSIVRNQQIELVRVPMRADGTIDLDALATTTDVPAALVVQHPNYFGRLEDVDTLSDWAAQRNVALIASVNPLSLAVLKPPGEWGSKGADIACGDGQPLGIPMASGGPSFGFMCCKMDWVRQMPGRIIGRTVDLDGKTGFTLTLQAREQHIRRAKATSNICTNQGLLVTAGTIYMAILGADGLSAVASRCHSNTQALTDALTKIPGVSVAFDGPFFHERVLTLPVGAARVAEQLAAERILIGHPLGVEYPALSNHLLVCATEKYGATAIERAAEALTAVLAGGR